MFERSSVLYIKDYNFPKGKSKNKYLIVIENIKGQAIVATLPTSQQYVDDKYIKNKGAFKQHETSGYYFPSGHIIGKKGFSFNLPTFVLFRFNVFRESIETIKKSYPNERISHLDTLSESEYNDLVYAIYKSETLKPELEKIFEDLLFDIN